MEGSGRFELTQTQLPQLEVRQQPAETGNPKCRRQACRLRM